MRALLLAVGLTAWAGVASATGWTADPRASHIGFSGVQLGTPFAGHFDRFTAAISFDPSQPQAGSADIVVDMTSAVTGDGQRDSALPQPEWFDAKKFASARFHAASFLAKGGDAYEAHGTLTLRGVSVDVVLPFKLSISGTVAHATGHTELVRTAFGVGQGVWAGDQYVALQVGVDIDISARQTP